MKTGKRPFGKQLTLLAEGRSVRFPQPAKRLDAKWAVGGLPDRAARKAIRSLLQARRPGIHLRQSDSANVAQQESNNNAPRNLAGPRDTWRKITESPNPPFPVFGSIPRLHPPPTPLTHPPATTNATTSLIPQRFGGFETPCHDWLAGCAGRPWIKWQKWAVAEPGGTPRNLTEPTERPNGGIDPPPLKSAISRVSQFRVSRFLISTPSPNTQRFGGFETLGIGRWPKNWSS